MIMAKTFGSTIKSSAALVSSGNLTPQSRHSSAGTSIYASTVLRLVLVLLVQVIQYSMAGRTYFLTLPEISTLRLYHYTQVIFMNLGYYRFSFLGTRYKPPSY